MQFNRRPLELAGRISERMTNEIRVEPGLFRASLDDAIRFGGDIVRDAIRAMNLRHDRRNVVIDVKVHMLMPGFFPAIPGWHTDGAPRSPDGSPSGKGPPDIMAQESGSFRPHRFHLLVTQCQCLTEFVAEPISINVPAVPTTDLYKHVTRLVGEAHPATKFIPGNQVVEFDWWDLHRGVAALKHEWRCLVRAVESDHYTPNRDLRDVLRNQQQVYVPMDFGW